MVLKPLFKMYEIDAFINKKVSSVTEAILAELKELGEACVQEARQSGQYHNITGNLRSSIGYVIANNGRAVFSNFQQVKDGSKGVAEGRKFAEEKASKHSGYVLVIVAGMDYALYVESNGKNVLSTTSHKLNTLFPKAVKRIQRSI